MRKFKYIPTLIVVATITVLILITVVVMKSVKGSPVNTSEGESYIAAMGEQDVQEVENLLRGNESDDSSSNNDGETSAKPLEDLEIETEPLDGEGFYGSNQACYVPYTIDDEKAQEVVDKLDDGSLSTKELFKDTLFVGDSIMTGFSDFQLANQGNVIATVGSALNPHLEENIEKIINYNPEYLILHYGLNEMDKDEYFVESFIDEYTRCLKKLQKELPATKIIVIGLMPIKDIAVEEQPRLAAVEVYNERMRAMCVELGVAYSEDSQFFVDNADLYTQDGIHVQRKLYVKWINCLVKEMGIY